VTQDKPLASVFRQEPGHFLQLWKCLNGARRSFPGIRRNAFIFCLKALLSFLGFMRLGKKLPLAAANSVFGVLSLLTPLSDRFYHAVAFTSVVLSAPIEQVEQALKTTRTCQCYCCGAFFSILQTEMMIETAHRMGSRLVSFLLILCRDLGFPTLMELRLI